MRPLFQQCDNPVWVRGETLVSQAIWCTSVVLYWYKSAPKRQCVRQFVFNISNRTSHKMPIFHNAITVLGSRGEAPKRLRAKPFGALVHWFEIDTYQHRKDSVRAKRAKNFNYSNHISHEMPLFWQHIATFVINFQPLTKLLGGTFDMTSPPLQILRGTCSPPPPPVIAAHVYCYVSVNILSLEKAK